MISSLKPVPQLIIQHLRKVDLAHNIRICSSHCRPTSYITLTRPIDPARVRMGFIPESWFKFFCSKTGVTGPYVFGLGLINYLLSKEIYVCDHEFYGGLSFAIMCVVAVKRLGPNLAKYLDKEIDKFENNWQKRAEQELQDLQNMIDEELFEQYRAEGSLLLIQAKESNIALQLEAAYRAAIMDIYHEVIHRLDYQVDCKNIEHRILSKHMIEWVIKEVTHEFEKKLDQESMEEFKKDLSALALSLKL